MLGLSFVFERFVWLYGVLKLPGGVYLIYLSVTGVTWRGQALVISAERYEIQAVEGLWMDGGPSG